MFALLLNNRFYYIHLPLHLEVSYFAFYSLRIRLPRYLTQINVNVFWLLKLLFSKIILPAPNS